MDLLYPGRGRGADGRGASPGLYTAGLCGHCLSFLASDAARRVRARRRTGSPAPLGSPLETEDAQPLVAV